MLLKDKVALITGAGNGIGRATAIRFAQEGAKLILSDFDKDSLDAVGSEIEQMGAERELVEGNVTSREDVTRMVSTAVDKYNRLDILINNAGITRDGLTTRIRDDETKFMSDEKWDQVINVNLKGTWMAAQIAGEQMIKQKYGRINNTSSVGALGNIGQANYSASKAGVIGITKTLALEWARYGIAVNAVAPGGVKTQMTAAIPDKVMQGLLQHIPFGRMAEPEEVAALHAFLASDEAAYITGQVIFIDGGLTAGA